LIRQRAPYIPVADHYTALRRPLRDLSGVLGPVCDVQERLGEVALRLPVPPPDLVSQPGARGLGGQLHLPACGPQPISEEAGDGALPRSVDALENEEAPSRDRAGLRDLQCAANGAVFDQWAFILVHGRSSPALWVQGAHLKRLSNRQLSAIKPPGMPSYRWRQGPGPDVKGAFYWTKAPRCVHPRTESAHPAIYG